MTHGTITYDLSAVESVIEQFGWEEAEDGIVDSDNEIVVATDGDPIYTHELGGIVPDENGDPAPLRGDFNSICEYVEARLKT